MDLKQIGKFIRKLREEKGWSQEELASKVYVDRSTIAKWERGVHQPNTEMLVLLSEIFEVSLNEILSGKKNKVPEEKGIIRYLKVQETKIKKTRHILFFTLVLLITVLSGFLIYYFLETYNTIFVYQINGEANSFEIHNGLFIKMKDKMYLQLGPITTSPTSVQVYYLEKEEKNLIYSGDPTITLIDTISKNHPFYKKNIQELIDHLYLEFTTLENTQVTIKLNLEKEFQNDQLFFKNYEDQEQEDSMNDSTSSTSKVPVPILKEFTCDSKMCILKQENKTLSYDISEEIFKVEGQNEEGSFIYEYIVNQKLLKFQWKKETQILQQFTYQWPVLVCETGSCANANKEIKTFEEEFKNIYLK